MKETIHKRNTLLYLIPLFIWGSTWFVIKFQLGTVDPLLSVVYRFLISSLILMVYLKIKKFTLSFPIKTHMMFFFLGTVLFGINYWFVYEAEEVVTSGLIALIFSSIVFFNSLNSRIFLKLKMRIPVLMGGLLGIIGIFLVFFNEVLKINFSSRMIIAYILAIIGAYIASLGNVYSFYLQNKKRISVMPATAFGMLYGAVAMSLIVIISGKSIIFDFSPKYIFSILYLSIFGSVVAFTAYLTVLGRMGADKAGNAVLAAPVLAVILSTVFEKLNWSITMFIGIALVISGNYIALKKRS